MLLFGGDVTGNSLIRFMMEDGWLLAVVDPFAIKNTEGLENLPKRLIAEAIEERHRYGLSQPVRVEAAP